MEPEAADEEKLLKIISKVHMIEAQENLILLVKDNEQLFKSKILSSLQRKVGKSFGYADLESNKRTLLLDVRKQLLELAAEERKRDLATTQSTLNNFNLHGNKDITFMLNNKLQSKSTSMVNKINKMFNKKIKFHSNSAIEDVVFTKKRSIRKERRKKKSTDRKRKNRQNYRRNCKKKR